MFIIEQKGTVEIYQGKITAFYWQDTFRVPSPPWTFDWDFEFNHEERLVYKLVVNEEVEALMSL
ncbi:hypothetical protein [Gracilibacillus massiliensis]|uniref:hypothetical protein n=1 Tax=Gracilibacillus massiliensis TaxID=1564956 RepID=UPI00071C36C1|nr:hypothetical protein [Gracilibacillus massiliensis]